ncbi:membrane dipeptidase [Streptomyces werraensis]|uniref:membrane dipeptidase n=1 Tax=Streptomyces werraensis TaxID=68284 RepID=UPI003811625D
MPGAALDGVWIASIAHLGRAPLADGSGKNATDSRLTKLGMEALPEMERLSILCDVSHVGTDGVAHVLELATHPVLDFGAWARYDHRRNLTTAASGGAVCVNY